MNEETVSIRRNDLEVLVGAFKQIRSVFLLCAPAYSAGSRGEALVRMAEESVKVIQSIELQLRPKDPKDCPKGERT